MKQSLKQSWLAGVTILAAALLAMALLFPISAAADEDQVKHPACPYCGMDRTKFAHSRALITYDDDTVVGTCSLHCAAIDLSLKIDKTPTAIMVADYGTKKLIDAQAAHWVIGGRKAGVMTRRAKWAFADRAGAEAFMAASGGSPRAFEVAIKAVFEDMYADLKMIREKRKKMRANKKQ